MTISAPRTVSVCMCLPVPFIQVYLEMGGERRRIQQAWRSMLGGGEPLGLKLGNLKSKRAGRSEWKRWEKCLSQKRGPCSDLRRLISLKDT